MPCAPRGRSCGGCPPAPLWGRGWRGGRTCRRGRSRGAGWPSPTAISFAPERSISSVRASMRLWSTIPASSRITVVSGPDARARPCPRVRPARPGSACCPARAGLSAPEPLGGRARDGDADHLASGGLLGACGRVDHDPLPGPGRVRSGPPGAPGRSAHRSACSLLARTGARRCARRPHGPRLPARVRRHPGRRAAASSAGAALDRLLLGRTASVVIRPPSKVRMRRSATISRVSAIASSGPSSPADCSSATARSSLASNIAARSVRRRLDALLDRPLRGRGRGGTDQMHRLIRPEAVPLPCPLPTRAEDRRAS